MFDHQERSIDPVHPYIPLFQGAYEESIVINGQKRRFLLYIPEETRESCAGLMILPENGVRLEQVYNESLWRFIADTEESLEKMVLIFLEPLDKGWNTNESYADPTGDVAYIDTVAGLARQRGKCCVHESKLYITGCRQGGVLANMAVMWNPTFYAGIVAVGGSLIAADYLAAAQNDVCNKLCGYTDVSSRNSYRKGAIPVPAWIIDDPLSPIGEDSQTIAYWQHACGVSGKKHRISPDTVEYRRKCETAYPRNQDCKAYVVRHSIIPKSSATFANLLLRRIWKGFLYRHRRWMADPEGDLRVTLDPINDLEMEYHCEVIEGWMREWYVYVPESVLDTPQKPVPLVFAMHGYSCNGAVYAGNSGWDRVARDRGFILALPTALYGKPTHRHPDSGAGPDNMPLPTWNFLGNVENGPKEEHFFKAMIEQICCEHAIDRSRMYITGHSHGSMMVQALAMTMSKYFAAAAPCSGTMLQLDFARPGLLEREDIKSREDCEIPIWMFCGEMEPWLIPHLPADGNTTALALTTWRKNNHLNPETPDNWTDGWTRHGDRWHDLTYRNVDGVPMVRFSWIEFFPHATMPEMSYRIWDEHFSRFSRENGSVVYHDRSYETCLRAKLDSKHIKISKERTK
ncbi:hypothetical protein NE562_03700 [Butyricicoccus faecihominis]|uniref:PHB depolymerase family esterase n=1 Tax=Butyricicoccus faecihominis TaxID=1712515 RepID=UPI002479690A|nr:PHB depolymerase family esterase [Butyricicoccus faecihominis]MCQ5128749.1 hypothetical protein [Butyricicoccus faecihominis]